MLAAITADEINAYLAEAFPISGQRCVEVGGRWAVAAITPMSGLAAPGTLSAAPPFSAFVTPCSGTRFLAPWASSPWP